MKRIIDHNELGNVTTQLNNRVSHTSASSIAATTTDRFLPTCTVNMYVYSCMLHVHVHVRLQLKLHVHVRLQLDATRTLHATGRRHTNYTQLNFGAERTC